MEKRVLASLLAPALPLACGLGQGPALSERFSFPVCTKGSEAAGDRCCIGSPLSWDSDLSRADGLGSALQELKLLLSVRVVISVELQRGNQSTHLGWGLGREGLSEP